MEACLNCSHYMKVVSIEERRMLECLDFSGHLKVLCIEGGRMPRLFSSHETSMYGRRKNAWIVVITLTWLGTAIVDSLC